MPKISVIVPVYNVEKYLNRCVDSILNQTFTDFECILVDDGSPDNCPKLCDEYAKKDKRIKVIHKQNGGLSDARNAGIDWVFKNSDSEWISFVDSDDWIHSRYLALLFEKATEYNVDISICGYLRTSGESYNIDAPDINPDCFNPELLWCENLGNAIVACGKLFKKSIWSKTRFPLGKLHEDEFVIYKLIFTNKILFLNTGLYFYFVNTNSITGVWSPERLSVLDARKEQIAFFKENGFNLAYKTTILDYIHRYSVAIREIDRVLPKYRDLYKQLKRKQKQAIKKYESEVTLPYASIYIENCAEGIQGMNLFSKLILIILYIKQFGISRAIKKGVNLLTKFN